MIAKILKENVPDCDIQVFCPHNEIVCGYISPNAGLMYHDNHNELTGDAFYLWGDQSSSYLRYSLQTNLDFYSGLLGAFSKTRNTSDDLGIGKGNIAITLADTIQQRLANINKESPIVIVDDLCNDKGYKQLDPHIGAIYGDSITPERAEDICERLKAKGFASTNIVFGIGSYTYQMVTRDTYGWAIKATYAEINGKGVNIFKEPMTDDGTKKSAKGLLKVVKEEGVYKLQQEVTWDQFYQSDNELKLRFKNGEIKQ